MAAEREGVVFRCRGCVETRGDAGPCRPGEYGNLTDGCMGWTQLEEEASLALDLGHDLGIPEKVILLCVRIDLPIVCD